ncbi:MAG TPA: gephyrin-like molybdotransferase Glp [Gaiellaceae bacterium]|nr:gephyrin-like molybdotransferase Glp [Gaiellaceae bacterium]
MSELLTVEQAVAAVVEHAKPRGKHDVEIGDAFGCVLAEDARAAVDLPPFDSSAMDGYAVRSGDSPGALKVVGHSAAGHPAQAVLRGGEAVNISTGAVVPDGADAVIEIERVQERGDVVVVEGVAEGANVRPRGGDVAAGSVIGQAGTRIAATHVGALAAAGVALVSTFERPRVAVLSTGSELRPPGSALAPGQIYESNSLLLAAQLRSAGIDADVLGAVRDDEAALRAALERGLQADVLLTSGGVSVGPHDLLKRLFDELGVQRVFWGVAMRPGKPLYFGVREETLVFGLPGNPVSTLVGFELFVRTALRACEGEAAPQPRFVPGRLATPLQRNAQRDELVRAYAQGGLVTPVSGQESHMIVRAAAANALAFIPRGEGSLAAGEHVGYLPV